MVTPLDIACFQYCSKTLEKESYKEKVIPSLTFFEEHMRLAIIDAERSLIFKDSDLNPKKILNKWDKLWWPAAMSSGISIKEAEELTHKASEKFSDYCKYDISDYFHPTAGADVEASKRINSTYLTTQIDLVKVDIRERRINITLVDFTRKNLSTRDIILDPAIRAKAYAFSLGKKETITYTCIDLNEEKEKLIVSSAVFRPEELEKIRKMIIHTESGIRNNIYSLNRWLCKECNICQSSKL